MNKMYQTITSVCSSELEKKHNLCHYMKRLTNKMADDYALIQENVLEDPGTAGDQGEENWANLLREWLPSNYTVKTKGRIASQNGEVSPQVDVIILKDIYPKQLIDEGQKTYLAAGVAAAFECKITLKAEHIKETVEKCVKIKNLYPIREGTPYKELHAPIVYGLLAHSHAWKAPKSTPIHNIEQKFLESDQLYVSHPRETLDLICVADLGTWLSGKIAFIGPTNVPDWESSPELHELYGKTGSVLNIYTQYTLSHQNQSEGFTPIGALISNLSRRLAWENPALRDIVEYYHDVQIGGVGEGDMRRWDVSIYSEEVQRSIVNPLGYMTSNILKWDEWQIGFNLS